MAKGYALQNDNGETELNSDKSSIVKMGTATLVGGTVQVAYDSITADMKVILSNNGVGGTIGILSVAVSAGMGFTITSANVLDTSTIAYIIIKP